METTALHWDDLRYFLHATRSRSQAGAARALGVEHTTVGRRLSALERALGAPLVLRGPDGLRLTELGERVAPLAEEIERLVATLCDLAASRTQRVRLAVPSGFTEMFASHLATHQELAGIALEIVSGSRPVDLERGEADLAIRSGPITSKELVARKLCETAWALYAAAAYLERKPLLAGAADLSGHDLIGYDSTLASLPAAKWVEEHASGARIVLRSREMTDMLMAAKSAIGVAVLPCLLGDPEPALHRLTPEPVATRRLSLVYRREARLSPNIAAVARFVVDVVREYAPLIGGVRTARDG